MPGPNAHDVETVGKGTVGGLKDILEMPVDIMLEVSLFQGARTRASAEINRYRPPRANFFGRRSGIHIGMCGDRQSER